MAADENTSAAEGSARQVGKVPSGNGKTDRQGNKAKTGKPKKILGTSQMSRFAEATGGLDRYHSARAASFGGLGGISNTVQGVGGNAYSPELSTDFNELPQSLHEQWSYYRFFYRSEPFVGQALDLHTELPLSKIRIGIPKARSRELALAATRFCEKWAQTNQLLQRLISIVHERNLIGEAFIWSEDDNPEMPQNIRFEARHTLTEDGEAIEEMVEREDADERASRWLKKNYKGWTSVRCLPPEQVRMESFNFTDERIFELVPDSKTKHVIDRANSGDPDAIRIVMSMPADVVNAVSAGNNIPLNTDPYAGSFVYYLANRKSDYEPRGRSILERCMRVLVYRDKLRQSQTSIASRHMTPIRVVYGLDLSETQLDDLRDQVDQSLQDPDYSIITNFEVTWEEMGADSRLLDLTGEYDLTDRQLYSGLGVTEGLLSGESAYSGDRINLEVINVRYMLLREQLQELVQENFFKPMCYRMGFIEDDEDGEPQVIVPTLTFTRLALKDNRDTFDQLYNLFTKGNLDVDTILELLNLDPVSVNERVQNDMLTPKDATYNEVLRGVYNSIASIIGENSNLPELVAKSLGPDVTFTPPKVEAGGRFASKKGSTPEERIALLEAKLAAKEKAEAAATKLALEARIADLERQLRERK